jgi:radical SAM protein with 4Fe4S-binding SPASM domain
MAIKQFLQSLFERAGLAESPLPPPHAADVAVAELEQLRPILQTVASWGVKQARLAAGDGCDTDDLLNAARLAAELGLDVAIRGRATCLAAGKLLADLAAAGASEVELPLLSSVAEVHDALAGMGDHRALLKALDALPSLKLRSVAQVVLTPSTWKTISQTLTFLDDRRIRSIHLWAIVCRDDEPSSWALSASELVASAAWIEAHAPRDMQCTWYPPLKFDPARTLAQQVRLGPRAGFDAVSIGTDGNVRPPVGPATADGTVFQSDWKAIARNEVFRAWKRHRDAAKPCEKCPGLKACSGRCLRDEGNWTIA